MLGGESAIASLVLWHSACCKQESKKNSEISPVPLSFNLLAVICPYHVMHVLQPNTGIIGSPKQPSRHSPILSLVLYLICYPLLHDYNENVLQ